MSENTSSAISSDRFQGGSRERLTPTETPPLVSIVVVVFRAKDELAELIENLTPFRSCEVELVIIDGGSKDGTRPLLESNSDKIDFWLSEPDSGIYDAMNKGVALAHGEYILHINAGDRLLAIPAAELRKCAAEEVDVAAFCVQLDDGVFQPGSTWSMKIFNRWHHQGTFYRRVSHLGYDTSYRVFADFDHNQRLAKGGIKVYRFPHIIAQHLNSGASANISNFHEVYRCIRKNAGSMFLPIAFLIFKLDGINRRASGALDRGRSVAKAIRMV